MVLRSIIVLFLLISSGFAETVSETLARLDREVSSFRQATAHLTRLTYTAILKDTTRESGELRLLRRAGKALVRIEIQEPDARSYSFEGTTGLVYYPKINTVQVWDLGKNRSLIDQFLLLGFGSSGKALAKNYGISPAGEETIGGRRTTHLVLTPKSATLRSQFSEIELWIPLDAPYAIQQKLHQPGGDYYLVTYSDVRLNPGLPDAAFRLKLPSDAKREYPQK